MHVHEKVQKYIEKTGIEPGEVAKKAGLTKELFEAKVYGKRVLYADELRDICIALNVSPELFIGTEKHTGDDSNKGR